MNFLLAWYNLPFVVSMACSLGLALLQMVGGFGDHDADADADADIDADGDGDIDSGIFGDALGALGVGKVPLMLILMIFLAVFGIAGLLVNAIFSQIFAVTGGLPFLLGLVLGLVFAFFLTGRLSRGFARLAPDNSIAIGFEQLVGRVGRVTSPTVSPTYGRVAVRDKHGTLHTVYAIIETGAAVPEHSEVALLSYDAKRRCFLVKLIDRAAV